MWKVTVASAVSLFVLAAAPIHASAGSFPALLDNNGGAMLPLPAIHNLYWDSNWDADNSAKHLTRGLIDARTADLTASDYFSKALQYGVLGATFTASDTAPINSVCGNKPGSFIDVVDLELRVTCEANSLLFSGGPSPFTANVLYVVYLPAGVSVGSRLAGIVSCSDFGAYHFSSFVGVPPIAAGFGYAVVPVDCASNLDSLTALASHEIIEAATDLTPPTRWIDNSTFDIHNIPAIFQHGEAADICLDKGASPVRMSTGVVVSPYWSNADGACVPNSHLFGLTANFAPTAPVPGPVVTATVNGFTETLPFTDNFEDGATVNFSFQSTVSDPAVMLCDPTCQVAHRWATSDPGDTFTITSDFFHTAIYQSQFLYSMHVNPAAAGPGDHMLTRTGFFNEGSLVTLTTDALIPAGVGDRYRFDRWSINGDANPTTTVLVTTDEIVFANYVLQHQVSFAETGIPAGLGWMVTVNGTAYFGPFKGYFDDRSTVSFQYQTPVPGAIAGTRYVFSGASATSGFIVVAPQAVTGTYVTQYLLTVSTTGLGTSVTHIANSGSVLGTATDASPLTVWLSAGTTLSLTADPRVTGANGTQLFFHGFSPAPPASLTSAFNTTATYTTVAAIIAAAIANGGLSGPGASGLANSYNQQFAAVEADIAAGDHVAALIDLRSFISHSAAQSGKKLTAAAAAVFELDALLVYHDQLCLAAVGGQITPATTDADYAYYSSTVTSLGGTPLPPC